MRVNERLLAAAIFLVFFAPWPSSATEQAEVCVILSADLPPYRQAFDGFRKAVQERKGMVRTDDHNLARKEGEAIIQEISREKPSLVLAIGPEASKFAKERIRTIPVVFSMVLNPAPLAAPNVTGVSLEIPARTKLERIRRVLPDARRIGVIYSPASAPLFREIVQGARSLGLQAVGKEIDSGKELHDAFDDLAPRIDLLLMVPDTKIYFPKSIEFVLREGLKHKVPVVGLASSYTRAGALVSFESDYADLGRQSGEIAVKIMDGEKPSRIEPSGPRRVKTSLNLVVAERLGIRIAPELVREMNDVFR